MQACTKHFSHLFWCLSFTSTSYWLAQEPARGRPPTLLLVCVVTGEPPSSSNQWRCTDCSSESKQRQMTCPGWACLGLTRENTTRSSLWVSAGCDGRCLHPLLAAAPLQKWSVHVSVAPAPRWALAILPCVKTGIFSGIHLPKLFSVSLLLSAWQCCHFPGTWCVINENVISRLFSNTRLRVWEIISANVLGFFFFLIKKTVILVAQFRNISGEKSLCLYFRQLDLTS